MRACHVSHLLLVLGTLTTSSIAQPPAPKVEPIRLPVLPTPQPPQPPIPGPVPTPITSLGSDQLYVVDSDLSCLVLTSPAGIVSVTQDAGPLKIRGKFVDGSGKTETREYKGKQVFTIEATATGRVELLIVPQGATVTLADVIRRTIDVTAGQGPIPPPKPKPDPNVDPTPTPTALWGFVVIEETSAAVEQRGAFLADPPLAGFLKSKGLRWRIVDRDVVGADGKPPRDVQRMLAASMGKTLPQLFVIDVKGSVLAQKDLGGFRASDVLALLKQYAP